MKVKTLSALAGIGGAMILSSSAEAAFVNITAQLHTTTLPAQTGGIARDVYRVYANFTLASDTLTTIAGTPLPGEAFVVNLNGATPYNPGNGGDVPINAGALAYAPNAEFDSYATIGLTAGHSGPASANLTLTPGFPTMVAGNISSTNMSYTTGPGLVQGQGIANGPSFRVLIMQISVTAGQAAPSGVVGQLVYNVGGLTGVPTVVGGGSSNSNLVWSAVVPSPGALALLGLAGLVGGRRRRS